MAQANVNFISLQIRAQQVDQACLLIYFEPGNSYYRTMLRDALTSFDEARAKLAEEIERGAPLVVTADAPDEEVGF